MTRDLTLDLYQLALLIPPVLIVEGFFSGSEIALLSADRLELKRRARAGSGGAKLALALLSHPERILSTTLLVQNAAVVLLAALVAVYLNGNGFAHPDLLGIAISSPLVVLLGELIPKTLYQRRADRIAPYVAGPINAVYWALYPATKLLALYSTRLAGLVTPVEPLITGRRRSTRDEVRSILSYGKRETEIKTSEKRMIKRIFDFKDTEAKHALIPLVKVDAVESRTTARAALEQFHRHRHSRMPVFQGRIHNIIGVVSVADLLVAKDLDQRVEKLMSAPHYAAETQSLEDLLAEMHRTSSEMTVVVDEHGGAVGILTFEDIVEEVVGEIHDEDDAVQPLFRQIGESQWLVQSRIEILALNEAVKLDLPEGEYETLSGFLLQQFGRIPEARDELYFNTPSAALKFTIRDATERHIEAVIIERLPEGASSH